MNVTPHLPTDYIQEDGLDAEDYMLIGLIAILGLIAICVCMYYVISHCQQVMTCCCGGCVMCVLEYYDDSCRDKD